MLKISKKFFCNNIKEKLRYGKDNYGYIYKYEYNPYAYTFGKYTFGFIGITNTIIYFLEKSDPKFKLINKIGVITGMLFGLIGTYLYIHLSFRTIKSLKIHRY